VGVAADGRTSRFLSLGTMSGDWGGGYGLGLDAIWWAIRAEDGRGPETALREAVPGHFGLATVYDVAVAMHQNSLGWDAPLGLVPVLFRVAGAGDAVALDIVRRLAGEVCVMALSALRRLGLDGQPVPVVLGGGVLAARDPVLTAELAKRFAAEATLGPPCIVEVPPVVGAALLGLDRIGAPQDAHARLRDAYRAPAARHQLGERPAQAGVQARVRLIEQQRVAVREQQPPEGDPVRLATGQPDRHRRQHRS
jgi:N-acetylglucosamine kinase-like BadF-type ATPase